MEIDNSDDLKEREEVPTDIELKDHMFDIEFSPTADLIAISQITGRVKLYKYSCEDNVLVHDLKLSSEACRSVQFNPEFLFVGSSDGSLRAVSVETGKTAYVQDEAHESPVNAMHMLGPSAIVTGDDEGEVKLWDLRQQSCVMQWSENTDFISDFAVVLETGTILATGGDGHLSVFNMRKSEVEARSDNMEDELLSIQIIKNGKKVIVGTQEGLLDIWDWGDWGTFNDRMIGHPNSVDTMVVIDQNTICTGSSDGLIRICEIHPNRLLGVIGEHPDFPIERIKLSRDNRFLASCSHDLTVKFWNMEEIFESDEEGKGEEMEEEAMEMDDKKKKPKDNFFSDLL